MYRTGVLLSGMSMNKRRSLQPVDYNEGLSFIVQTTESPALRGQAQRGFDYACCHCEKSVLVENTIEGEVCDIAFECFVCQGLSISPGLPPGHSVPPGATVLPANWHGTAQPDHLSAGTMLVSAREEQRYRTEMGSTPSSSELFRGQNILDEIIMGVQVTLGDVYDSIDRGEKQWRAIGSPPGFERHPLMVLIDRVRRTSEKYVDTSAVTQLFTIQRLYHQFMGHPIWEKIRKQAQAPDNFTHDVLTLAYVAQLREVGNGINILDMLSGRAADIVGSLGPDNLINVEVKAPKALQQSGRLTPKQASKIVKVAFNSAKTTEGGQLNPSRPGLLVLGAMSFSDETIRILHQAIASEFERHIDTRKHILGVALVFFKQVRQSVHLSPSMSGLVGAPLAGALELLSGVGIELTRNPHYTGNFLVDYT